MLSAAKNQYKTDKLFSIIMAMIGGPAATPKKRILLYNEVIVPPLTSFSTPSVIRASRQGNDTPIPTPAIVNKKRTLTILASLFTKNKAQAAIILPIAINHFIIILFFPIFFRHHKRQDKETKAEWQDKAPFSHHLLSICPQVMLTNETKTQIKRTY